MGNIGLGEILILVLVVLILFGPNKLPELGKALGKAVGEFRRGIKEGLDDKESSAKSDDSTTPSKPA
jgi:sec-independent protein translocase protein TatA